MRVLLIGTGGREHALARSLAQDPSVDELICAPGNPGMSAVARLEPVDATDPAAVTALAVAERADL
ncbi:phosphoribosylamine--glycine ligase N-terminal domain-containing protein, partial [Stackebrandtia soli]|uniref:phosphoribosylamine--glycine ligase N-terminal domain-containing protein n=1 Tax=Stackebrandtia soli TaxID=1892856 RepID=UPI0039E98FC6